LRHYPIFLDLKNRPVLVVGGGRVALRKTKGLLEAGARVTVVSPESLPEFDQLVVRLVRLVRRKFRASDIPGNALVFAATNDRLTNHRVGDVARGKGIFANIVDSPEECDFLVPARVRQGNLQIAVSTGGQNPKLAAALRRTLERELGRAGLE
jgi:siroheme synthase-like protein